QRPKPPRPRPAALRGPHERSQSLDRRRRLPVSKAARLCSFVVSFGGGDLAPCQTRLPLFCGIDNFEHLLRGLIDAIQCSLGECPQIVGMLVDELSQQRAVAANNSERRLQIVAQLANSFVFLKPKSGNCCSE